MIVPEVVRGYEPVLHTYAEASWHGSVSSVDDRVKADKPARRIGFVREVEPDEAWRLYADYA